jgi:aspartate carbamoyltransferase regulatory subunit
LPNTGAKIFKILNLDELNEFVVVAKNLESKKQNRKDLIKIEGKELNKKELNKIALVSKNATINIIRNKEIYLKYTVQMPENIENILKCNNPNCISNHEKISSKFVCTDKENIILKCSYCEKIQNTIDII